MYGSRAAIATTATTLISNGRLGRLSRGLPAVRMTNTTSVCVAKDSTNQPVWKSGAFVEAWKTQRSIPKVRKIVD